MNYTFRIATEADVTTCADIFRRAVIELAPQLYTPAQVIAWSQSPDNLDRFSAFILKPVTFLACRDRNVLGFSGIEADGRIASLYVAPESSRQGVGSALLRQIISHAQTLDYSQLYAEASFFSRDLFLKFGFQVAFIEEVNYNGAPFKRSKVVLNLS
jgi:putative acetyltransferase